MKIHKIISKSKDDKRMEVVAIGKKGPYRTLHVHRYKKGWQYCAGFKLSLGKEKVMILKEIEIGGKNKHRV